MEKPKENDEIEIIVKEKKQRLMLKLIIIKRKIRWSLHARYEEQGI